MFLAPVRRVVTGHSPTGHAVIESDQFLIPQDAINASFSAVTGTMGFVNLWVTESSAPVDPQAPWTDTHGTNIPLSDNVGTTVRIVDFPHGPGIRHRTRSVDFAVVLEGELELELDNGVKTIMKKNDVAVQRGTIHAWRNVGEGTARMMFVLIPSEPVKVGDKELEETGFPPR